MLPVAISLARLDYSIIGAKNPIKLFKMNGILPDLDQKLPAWQILPDGRIFGAQHPRAEAFESAILHQLVAILKGMQVGVKDPLPHLVAIEPEVSAVVKAVPLDLGFVGLGQ